MSKIIPLFFLFSSTYARKASSKSLGSIKPLSSLYMPRGVNQQQYVNYLKDTNISILLGVGPAGTGKTLFACNEAVQELKSGSIQKIVLTRPIVSVDEELGFLPGSLIKKMDPWTRPIFDILLEYYSQRDVDLMMSNGVIEISPLAYMRGRTFKNSFIIADEMQNSSPSQMLMLTTRLGDLSKMVITGDLKQSDRMVSNGLADLIQKMKSYPETSDSIKMVQMDVQDVQRSAAVTQILDIYNYSPKILTVPIEKSEPPLNKVDVINVQSCKTYENVKHNDAALIPNDPLNKKFGYKKN